MKYIDFDKWERKEHFQFFLQYDEPYFGVTVDIDCSHAYITAKTNGVSFYATYLHKVATAMNSIEEFRYRIFDGKPVIFEKINVSMTLGRKNSNVFACSFIEYDSDFNVFYKSFQEAANKANESTGLGLSKDTERIDSVHCTAIPWIQFTSMTHARNFKGTDTCPMLSFGKVFDKDNKKIMPVSINVHHSLTDAYHSGKFLELFQKLMNE